MKKIKKSRTTSEKNRIKKLIPSSTLDVLYAANVLSDAEDFCKEENLKRYIKKHRKEIDNLKKRVNIDILLKRVAQSRIPS